MSPKNTEKNFMKKPLMIYIPLFGYDAFKRRLFK